MQNFNLNAFSSDTKAFLKAFLVVLTLGLCLGIYFVQLNTSLEPTGIVSHYNGNEMADEFEISYGKSLKELVLTTHNHIISFAFIFVLLGAIFLGVQNINARLKRFLLIEPFVSIVVTFGSMFLIRYVHPNFVFVMIASSTLMYLSYFIMVFYCFRELRK